jgi:DNA-binding GntR family transcriptional regulator
MRYHCEGERTVPHDAGIGGMMVARSRPAGNMETVKQSLGETVYAALRRAIIRCELRPGQQITEGELAERFGAAKATLRVILNRLSHERLVQILPREGYLIAPLTLKQVQDLFGARLVLEPAVARLAAGHLDEAQRQLLDRLCQERYRVGDQESIEEFLSRNAAFHIAVARATGNERLADMIADLLAEMERVLHFSYLLGDRNEETISEHRDLLDALIADDGERAERLVRERLIDDRRVVLDALMTSPALQTVNLAAR